MPTPRYMSHPLWTSQPYLKKTWRVLKKALHFPVYKPRASAYMLLCALQKDISLVLVGRNRRASLCFVPGPALQEQSQGCSYVCSFPGLRLCAVRKIHNVSGALTEPFCHSVSTWNLLLQSLSSLKVTIQLWSLAKLTLLEIKESFPLGSRNAIAWVKYREGLDHWQQFLGKL